MEMLGIIAEIILFSDQMHLIEKIAFWPPVPWGCKPYLLLNKGFILHPHDSMLALQAA